MLYRYSDVTTVGSLTISVSSSDSCLQKYQVSVSAESQVFLTNVLCLVGFPESTCDEAPANEELCKDSPIDHKIRATTHVALQLAPRDI